MPTEVSLKKIIKSYCIFNCPLNKSDNRESVKDITFNAGHHLPWPSQVVPVVKNPPASAGDIRDMDLILGWKDPLAKGIATNSTILAWRILRIEPG